MEQVRYMNAANGQCLVMVMLSEAEMRVIRHAIRSSNALQLTGKVAEEPAGDRPPAMTGGELSQTVLFMVKPAEPVLRPQKVRWIRARRDKVFLTFMNGPLLDWKPEFKEIAPETPAERAVKIVEHTPIVETFKVAA